MPCRTAISCTVQISIGHVLSVRTVAWAPDQSSLSSFRGPVHQLSSLPAMGTVCHRACHRAQALSRAGVVASVPLSCWHAQAHTKHPNPGRLGGSNLKAHLRKLASQSELGQIKPDFHIHTPVEQGLVPTPKFLILQGRPWAVWRWEKPCSVGIWS